MRRWDPLLHPLRSALSSSNSPNTTTSAPDSPTSAKHVHFAEDHTPSSIKLKVVCGPRHDPSLIIYIKLRFESMGKPRLGFKIRHPREERDESIERGERRDFDQRVRFGDRAGPSEGGWMRSERVGGKRRGDEDGESTGARKVRTKRADGQEDRGRDRYKTEEQRRRQRVDGKATKKTTGEKEMVKDKDEEMGDEMPVVQERTRRRY